MTGALLFLICCTCFFVLAFIALFNPAKVNVVGNRWMGVFYISVAGVLMNAAITATQLEGQYRLLTGLNELTRFAMMPALYLAIVQFTIPGSRFGVRQLLHFIPFIIFVGWLIPAMFGYNFLWQKADAVLVITAQVVLRLQFLVYWILAYQRLVVHQKHMVLIASDVKPVNLSWLKYLLLVIGLMLVASFAGMLLSINWFNTILPAFYLAGCLCVLYYSLAQKEVYPYQPEELNNIREVFTAADENIKIEKQRLTPAEAEQLHQRLLHLMNNDKIFLEPELSLPDLAARMPLTVNDMSYLLNEQVGVNFFQFINSYRIDEAKQLMLSSQHKHLSILGIAYSAGFSSKTTFNTAFKKETGLSPSQFIKNAGNPNVLTSAVS